MTTAAGFSGDAWSTSAAFVDYDRDGDLDLYVVHYVLFDPTVICRRLNDAPDFCGPRKFKGVLDTLYRNNGDGTFTDVTALAGIALPGNGVGVICADLTGDGWVDFYVTNDGEANHLWVNRGDGAFADEAIMRGVAFNTHGMAEASMGVAVGDADDDGEMDLFMTHLSNQTNTLYNASSYGIFGDVSDASGFAGVDLPFTGFGCGFFDVDHDGDLDLAVVNGRVARGPVLSGATVGTFWNPYAEPNLLFQNDGRGRFSDVSSLAGAFTAQVEVSRGLAFGDIDRDGDIDLVVANLSGKLRVFRNDAPAPGTHWLLVRAVTGNRDAIGAYVTVVSAGPKLVRLALPGYSYQSSNHPRAHFGLGQIDQIEAIEVTWPDGERERFEAPGVNRELTVRQGDGEAL